ncbi:DUF4167 domain-containing protein [Acetobacter sp.]|uniref:DUF4167 domain-containing protein n=1 Tax=Acetobacter sp. TaxID=440 RepID=UPI0025BE0E4E|nr:DUF4167 domain-containing protein [Acetobacter sp.]MCH4089989.1 DUF4167 domain-containing protein [Acetobacter sp.]MCI1298685.1 DUF4167 domain-containing protein [Acetobacter sp.]MCI1315250.1 DUF4167 domain-containing protein [Acetobacter sp.]
MNIKRMRNRNHRPGGSNGGGGGTRHQNGQIPLNRNHVFDSNGPEVRIRGTAQQLFEKYLQLGRDATSGGDRVLAEAYFQHAEHYFRILNAMNQAAQQAQQERQERSARTRAPYKQDTDSSPEDEENQNDPQPEAFATTEDATF